MKPLAEMTWPQIRELQQSVDLLVVPLGATEQHGPALPVGTDSLIAEAVCAAACVRAGVPWAPVWSVTCSVGHTAKWPGTFSLAPQTFIAALVEYGRWVEATGWKKLYFVNAHAGNHATLRVAVDQLRLELLGRLQVGGCDTFTLTPEITARFTADAADLHANKAECDLLLHLAPSSVDRSALVSADDPDRTEGLVFSYPVSQTSLNGTTGRPSLGCAEDGCTLFALMVDALAERLQSARTETPPLPAELWSDPPPNFSL
jgi:creatinine amidohydrolase